MVIFAGATTTVLYGIDATRDVLVTQNPPNNGTLNTVGSLGVNASGIAGFDIAGCDNEGFVALTPAGETVAKLYKVNLATGAVRLVGSIGADSVIGIAVR